MNEEIIYALHLMEDQLKSGKSIEESIRGTIDALEEIQKHNELTLAILEEEYANE